MELLRKVISIDPHFTDGYLQLVELHASREEHVEVIEWC
jgi:hypothetical protein